MGQKVIQVRNRNKAVLNYIRSVEADGLNKSASSHGTRRPNPVCQAISICTQVVSAAQDLQNVLAEGVACEAVCGEDANPICQSGGKRSAATLTRRP